MIFSPDMAKAILASKKSQTRRVVKDGEKRCRYHKGKVYALQPGRGRRGIEQITILAVRQERLGAISLNDVKREGFRTTKDFETYWTELHGTYDPDTRVWVITFAKGEHTDTPRLLRGSAPMAPTCTAILKDGPRKGKVCGRAFADRDYLTDKPIDVCACGARRAEASVEDQGYTTRRSSAMRGEAEAVPADVQKALTKRAADNHENGYIVQRERLMAVLSDFRPFAKDPATIKHLKGVERQLAALDRKMRPAAA